MEEELRNRIAELEAKVGELEKKEQRRMIFNIVKWSIRLVILVVIVFIIWNIYLFVNNIIITPLNEVIERTKEITRILNLANIGDWFTGF